VVRFWPRAMPRYPSRYSSSSSFSFGPGPVSTALKALIGANVALFVLTIVPGVEDYFTLYLALRPASVVRGLWVWQLVTYMFLHAGLIHVLFNMLALWMIGAELERVWGTKYFLKYYFVCGIGAAVLTVLFSLLPFGFARQLYGAWIVGASGAIYGLLLAYALYFPNRPIYMFFLFPVPAKIFVAIVGAIAFYASIAGGGGVANATHLGGLLVGYIYLKGTRIDPLGELKYRYLKWKINRVRKKFDVHPGGRADDWNRRVH
jgi:membrane associated rhomboid family serine protease